LKEYDLYVPLTHNDGRPVADEHVQQIRRTLLEEFGGFTHFPQENEGVWKLGGVVFRDQVVILRVLSDDGPRTRSFFAEWRIELMRRLEQADVLIVERDVRLIR
jgi:hypothetical protein